MPPTTPFTTISDDSHDRSRLDATNVLHPTVAIARHALESQYRKGKFNVPLIALPDDLPTQAGAFVTLASRPTEELRGCIGTLEPTRPTLCEEIAYNALAAAMCDPRFPPVRAEELDRLKIKVDVLLPPETVTNLAELDPRRYGIVVIQGTARGLLLPDLPEVNDVNTQLAIAMQKGGIQPHLPMTIKRFGVMRFAEP